MENSIWLPILIYTPALIIISYGFLDLCKTQDKSLKKREISFLIVLAILTVLFIIIGIIKELVTAIDLTTAIGSEIEENLRWREFFSRINTFLFLLFPVFILSYNFLNRKKKQEEKYNN